MTTFLQVIGGIAGAVVVQILVFLVLFGGDHRSIQEHARRLNELDLDISKLNTRTQNLAIIASNMSMIHMTHYNPHPPRHVQERLDRISKIVSNLDIET